MNREFGYRAGGGGVPREVLEQVAVPAPAPPAVMQSGLSETGEGGILAAPPVDPERARQLEAAWAAQTGQRVGERAPAEEEAEDGYDLSVAPDVRETAREFIGRNAGALKRLAQIEGRERAPVRPDFTKLESVDLVANEVTVGGVRFALSGEARAEIAAIVVRVVRESIIKDLEAALGNEVQSVPDAPSGAGPVGLPEVPGA